MASPRCSNHDDRACVLLVSMFPEGDTIALCQECVPPFIADIVDALELMPALVARGEAVSKGAKNGRTRKKRSAPTGDAGETPSDAEENVPVETDA